MTVTTPRLSVQRQKGEPSVPTPPSTSDEKIKEKVEYPTYLQILFHFLMHVIRGPCIAVIAAVTLWPLYLRFCDFVTMTLGLEDHWVQILGTYIAHNGVFYAYAIFFTLCDRYGWFQKYRMHRPKHIVPSDALVRSTIKQNLWGHFVNHIPWLVMCHHLIKPFPASRTPLMPVGKMLAYFMECVIMHEVGFYTAHRLFHLNKGAYQKVHKVHHDYIGSNVWATEHVHSIEVFMGAIGAHLQFCEKPALIWFIWIMWRTADSCEHHSGYVFKGTFLSRIGLLNAHRTEFHDYHHTHNTGNFGTHIGLDFLLRTSDGWMKELKKRDSYRETGNLLAFNY